MAKGALIFQSVLQNFQEIGPDEELGSRVFYYLETPDGDIKGIYSDVKLTPGAEFSNDPLEATMPKALEGVVSYDVLRREVEQYYRDNVGATGRGIRLGPGAKGIVMRNNTLTMRKEVPVELIGKKKGKGW
jgi:hypothetical protein